MSTWRMVSVVIEGETPDDAADARELLDTLGWPVDRMPVASKVEPGTWNVRFRTDHAVDEVVEVAIFDDEDTNHEYPIRLTAIVLR